MNPSASPETDNKDENIEDHDIMARLNVISQFQDHSASILFSQLVASFNGGIWPPIPFHLGVVTIWAQKARLYVNKEKSRKYQLMLKSYGLREFAL